MSSPDPRLLLGSFAHKPAVRGYQYHRITHALAGPFATYQLAVLGADVIKVEHPEEPDQSRESGTDRALNRRNVGTSFLTQGSNNGLRCEQITYDHVIQASSGIMAATGTEEVNPIKICVPAVDYATETMAAFALASAPFQHERTRQGQYIDLTMLGVPMMMQASLLTGYFRNGAEPRPGNKQPFATTAPMKPRKVW